MGAGNESQNEFKVWEMNDNRRFTGNFRLILASCDGPAPLACVKGTDTPARSTVEVKTGQECCCFDFITSFDLIVWSPLH